MAIRVYRLAVVGCPRNVVEPARGASFNGVGKSCFCNRFVKPRAYTETHDSLVSSKKWTDDAAISGDHFLYWGATTRHLQDGSKARFQVVEQTEFYDDEAAADDSGELQPHPSDASYLVRATSVRIATSSYGKVAVRLKAEQASARRVGVKSTTQIFPDEDFGGKNGGVMGYACVFDPTLVEEQMKHQMVYLAELLQTLGRRKKKLALVCTKCDQADEEQIKLGASLAACAGRKPIPFFEVSSRDDVNVEDVFFYLIGHARKSPKMPRAAKYSPRSSRHYSVSTHISYKEVVALRKHDIHRAKDAYRRLLQKKITNFSSVWSEAYLMLEKEEEFSVLLQLAGKDGKEMVKNMFCLRLIEIKLTEGAKVFGMSTSIKKLNKEKLKEYQRYLSDALKSHPDLRDESVYDYVYSPSVAGDSASHSHQNSISSDNTSGSRSDTPDLPQPPAGTTLSPVQLAEVPGRHGRGGNTHSVALSDISDWSEQGPTKVSELSHVNHSVDLLSSHSPHLSPLSQTSQNTHSVYTYGSNPHLLESTPIKSSDAGIPASISQPLLDVTPAPPPPLSSQRAAPDKRLSNSMDVLTTTSPRLSGDHSGDDVSLLNAEPYLQPMEVQMVMHTLPRTHRMPESTSYHSIHSETQPSPRRQFPVQKSAAEISESMRNFGHRRTASNPWVLDGTLESVPPPVPLRDYNRTSKSPPHLNLNTLDPHESSLDFPRENRRSVASASLSPKPDGTQPQPQYADIDEVDKLSTVSGPFDEISDDPDSPADKKSDKNKSTPESRLVKKKSSTLSSDYEKIEEYITMAPSSSTLPRRSMITTDTPNPTVSSEHTPKKSVVPPPKAKKPKSRLHQSADSVIDDAGVTLRGSSPPLFPPSRRFTMLDKYGSSPQRASAVSNVRPLPPSPTKAVTSQTKAAKGSVSRNSSSGSNIYETIDDELLNRVYSRRRGSGLPKWAPPVEPKHYAQYMVILRKFFTDPHIISAWERTVQAIIPGGDISTYPPPYSSLPSKQTKRLGPTVEVPKPSAGSSEPVPKTTVHQAPLHARESSNDQYILPIVPSQAGQRRQSSSTPTTPGPSRESKGNVFSSPRALFASKRPASREDLIEMLNMSSFNQGDSSDSESSDESSDEGSEEEREEEEESGEEGVAVGGVGELREVGEMKNDKVVAEVEQEEGEQDEKIDENSSVNDQSPNQRHSVDDEFDSIVTSLNPILTEFDSILAPDSTPNDTPDSRTHVPPNSTKKECNPTLRESVSTDSDLDSSSLIKPSALFMKQTPPTGSGHIKRWATALEHGANEDPNRKREVPPVPKRKPTRRRGETTAVDGMSDSGISNCHSQTYDDGFNPMDAN